MSNAISAERTYRKLPIDYVPMARTRRGKYSREQILEAATRWLVTGSRMHVEEKMGIPHQTLDNWRKTDWWEPLVEAIRADKSEELDAALTGVIHRAVGEVADRLEGGEYRRGKDDDGKEALVRVPVSARDAMMIGAIAWDKRQIGRSLPTSITESTGDRLKLLQAQLAAVSGRIIDVTPEEPVD